MSPLVLKLKFAVANLAALACGGVGGITAHYTIMPMDWPLWRRVLWALIGFYLVLAGKALTDVAARSRDALRQYFFQQNQQREAARQQRLEEEMRHANR